jgi:DNA-binding transcriptional MerR regulator
MSTGDEVITAAEASRMLGMSRAYFTILGRRWQQTGLLVPVVQRPKVRLYRLADVQKVTEMLRLYRQLQEQLCLGRRRKEGA